MAVILPSIDVVLILVKELQENLLLRKDISGKNSTLCSDYGSLSGICDRMAYWSHIELYMYKSGHNDMCLVYCRLYEL